MKKDNSHILYGLAMRPVASSLDEYRKTWSSTKFSTDKDFKKLYTDHTAAKQILAGCAKIYILDNYQKVKDWSTLEIVIEDNSNKPTEYYKHTEKKHTTGSIRFMETMNRMNAKRHNPVNELKDVSLDGDSDFSLTINGKEHNWLSDDSVIVLADYIEKQLNNV